MTSRGLRTGMLGAVKYLTRHSIASHPTTKNYLAQNVNSAEAGKHCARTVH